MLNAFFPVFLFDELGSDSFSLVLDEHYCEKITGKTVETQWTVVIVTLA